MFLFVGILVACQPRERVIDYPAFQAKNSASLEISRIVLNDTATVIYADVEQYPGGWARVDAGIYILANGQKYFALKSEGLKLNEKFEMRDTGLLSFKLFFPAATERSEFDRCDRESDEPGGLAYLGIEFESGC